MMKNNVQRPRIKRNLVQKNYLKSLIYKSIFVLVILLILFIIKKFNLNSTNNIIKIVDKNINYEFNIVEDGKRIYNTTKGFILKSINSIEVFGGEEKPYESPIKGTIVNDYGDKIKVNGLIVENTGVEIQVNSEENPSSIIRGRVTKVERIDKKGYFVTVKNDDIEIVYGYLNKILVKEGENIDIGLPIGQLGESKDGIKYLRIEVKIDDANVDPKEYINFELTKNKPQIF